MPRPDNKDARWDTDACYFGQGASNTRPHDFDHVAKDGQTVVRMCRSCLRVAAVNLDTGEVVFVDTI